MPLLAASEACCRRRQTLCICTTGRTPLRRRALPPPWGKVDLADIGQPQEVYLQSSRPRHRKEISSDAMINADDLIPLRELLAATGLNRRTLFSWERRHEVAPDWRDHAGNRFYSLQSLRRIRALKAASDAGHRIGNLVDKSVAEIEGLALACDPDPFVPYLLTAAQEMDMARIDAMIRLRLRQEGAACFIRQTFPTLMQAMGARWEARALPAAGEHLVSAALTRHLLAALSAMPDTPGGPVAIAATLSGEQHEFGAICAAIAARLDGINSIYLGGSLPPRDIAAVALALYAKLVMVSVVFCEDADARGMLCILREHLPADINLLVGGRGVPAALPETILIAQDMTHIGRFAKGDNTNPGPFPSL
ncbi:MerR HTH family regulatory protein [Rhizobium sp. RU35A]|nr:MerR HTH family regulatory protein [Rhizobium sp. RU35A]